MLFSRPNSRSRVLRRLPILALLACTTAGATTAALADTTQPHTGSTRLQRPIADEPRLDQSLVAQLPAAAATPATPATSEAKGGGANAADAKAPDGASTTQPAAAAAPQAIDSATEANANSGASSASGADEAEYQIATLGPAMRPLHPVFSPLWPSSGIITTYFGEVGPYSPRGHAGLDIADDLGTPILAADEGEVLKAYWNEDGYGGLIVIGHPSGYETWYGHLSRIGVERGEHVAKGEQIGRMGSTGYSTGSHLHFEVRQAGNLRDPLAFLAESALQLGNN